MRDCTKAFIVFFETCHTDRVMYVYTSRRRKKYGLTEPPTRCMAMNYGSTKPSHCSTF